MRKKLDGFVVGLVVLAFAMAMFTNPYLTPVPPPPPFPWSLHPPVIGRYCVGVSGAYKGWASWVPKSFATPDMSDESCADMPNPFMNDNEREALAHGSD